MLSSHHEAMMPYAPRPPSLLVDRRYKQGAEVAPNCPRCDSPNTKFCYYNNYSLSQPRYFCKGCRRYWTKGGSLRNVPVGGGCRKNRRTKSSSVRSAAESLASGRDAAFGNRFPGPARPDMVLEGMVGNPANPGQGMPDVPSSGEGSGIDLAVLYAKFLNPPPADVGARAVTLEPAGQMDEAIDTFSGSSDLSPGGVLAPAQLGFCHDGFGKWSGPLSSTDPSNTTSITTTTTMLCSDLGVQAALDELNDLAMDQSCFDSLGLPADVGNLSSWCSAVPSLSTFEDTKYDSLDSFPDEAPSLHEGMINVFDHDWSVDCQGLEALFMP
jgi:hypothetical protein